MKKELLSALCIATLGFSSYAETSKEYVDLGLPSGTLWRTCNIGATKPEESGSYFAWGETVPKNIYYWSTYKWLKASFISLIHHTSSFLSASSAL